MAFHHRTYLRTAYLLDEPTNQPNNQPTPWSKILLEKQPVPRPVTRFLPFYGTGSLNIVSTTACPLSLSWARRIQSTSSNLCKIYFNNICSSMPIFPEFSLLQVSPPKLCMQFYFSPWLPYALPVSSSSFCHPNIFGNEHLSSCYREPPVSAPPSHLSVFLTSLPFNKRYATHKATHMATLGGELCTTISVCISGTMEPGAGTTPPEVSKSTSGACRGGGTCTQRCPLSHDVTAVFSQHW